MESFHYLKSLGSLSRARLILSYFIIQILNKHFLENLLYTEAVQVNYHIEDIQEILLKR